MVASEVLRRYECDEVWLMPCFKHAEEKPLPSAQDRLAMTRVALATLCNPRVKATDFEIKFFPRKNYTADTVKLLQEKFPQNTFYWIIGSELLAALPKWTKWSELRTLLPLIVYPRPGYGKPSKKFVDSLKADLFFLDGKVRKSKISSTEVRGLLVKRDVKAKKFIPPQVFDYIRKRGLYGWRD